MPEVDQYADITFPIRGMDQVRGFETQRPGTTILGSNVRGCDPETFRFRGGSRPGLVRYAHDTIPAGTHLIQDLNIVIFAHVDALTGSPDAPAGPDTIDDPSSTGPPSSWGTGIINDDNPHTPFSGVTEGSRNPGGPGSTGKVYPRRVPKGGSAKPPNKNSKRPSKPDTIDPSTLGPMPRYKFTGFAKYAYSYNLGAGQQDTDVTFSGVICWPYLPGIGIQPPNDPAGIPTLQADKNAYFARIAFQNPTGISLVKAWWASADQNGLPLPSGTICNCDDIHTFGGYDGGPGNNVPCPPGS